MDEIITKEKRKRSSRKVSRECKYINDGDNKKLI